MHAAAVQANGPVLGIGTDCPVLTATHLRDAANLLRNGTDVVVYPADDGGYVLIGMRQPRPVSFSNMAWGTDGVMLLLTRWCLTHLNLNWREPAQSHGRRPADRCAAHAAGRDALSRGWTSTGSRCR